MAAVLALDLGGTRLKAGLIDANSGDVMAQATAATAGADAEEALRVCEKVAAELLGSGAVAAAALSVPGIVEDGVVTALPGKFDGIEGRDLTGWLQTFAQRVVVVNDAVAYGAGEARFGAGAGHRRVLVMTIGTGVGVTVLQDGHPVAPGPLGAGILGGQIPIDAPDTGPRDTSGRQGTIEARCAATAITAYAAEAGLSAHSVIEVYEAAEDGDAAARAALDVYRSWLARAVVALAHAHSPSALVLGGGPMQHGNPVFTGLQRLVDPQLWAGYSVSLHLAALGDSAALRGLAALSIDQGMAS